MTRIMLLPSHAAGDMSGGMTEAQWTDLISFTRCILFAGMYGFVAAAIFVAGKHMNDPRHMAVALLPFLASIFYALRAGHYVEDVIEGFNE